MALRVLEKVQILTELLGPDFFFLSRSNDDLHFLHTQSCRFPIFPHMRRVKYGVFKNRQKILKIKLKSFSLCLCALFTQKNLSINVFAPLTPLKSNHSRL
jgi:hypothetical protein